MRTTISSVQEAWHLLNDRWSVIIVNFIQLRLCMKEISEIC